MFRPGDRPLAISSRGPATGGEREGGFPTSPQALLFLPSLRGRGGAPRGATGHVRLGARASGGGRGDGAGVGAARVAQRRRDETAGEAAAAHAERAPAASDALPEPRGGAGRGREGRGGAGVGPSAVGGAGPGPPRGGRDSGRRRSGIGPVGVEKRAETRDEGPRPRLGGVVPAGTGKSRNR